MRAAAILLISAMAVSGFASAQTAPEQVTASQVSHYQMGIERGCKNQGRQRGDPVERVDALCACMIETMKASLSQAEWQKAFYFALTRRPEEEMQVVAPYLPTLQTCKSRYE